MVDVGMGIDYNNGIIGGVVDDLNEGIYGNSDLMEVLQMMSRGIDESHDIHGGLWMDDDKGIDDKMVFVDMEDIGRVIYNNVFIN